MFQWTLRQRTWEIGQNNVPIRMAPPLQNSSFTVKLVALEKVYLVIQKTLRLFVNRLTLDDKHYLLKRDNLTQPIQIQLSQKQKIFSELFFALFKSILNFKHCQKTITLITDVFWEIPAPKNMVR